MFNNLRAYIQNMLLNYTHLGQIKPILTLTFDFDCLRKKL